MRLICLRESVLGCFFAMRSSAHCARAGDAARIPGRWLRVVPEEAALAPRLARVLHGEHAVELEVHAEFARQRVEQREAVVEAVAERDVPLRVLDRLEGDAP